MRKLLLIIALFCVPVTSFAVGASWPLSDTPRFWLLGESSTHVSLDTSYFLTRENYNKMGVVEKPSALNTLSYTNAKFHIGYGFAPKVSLFAQFDGRGLFEKNNLHTNQADVENYGLGDVFVGLRWLLYRSRASDRVYPTEWTPNSWLVVAEGTWNFPLYDKTAQGKPPLGDQSNDFTALGRLAWYANEWLGLSGSLGYTYRTAGYSAALPWNLRADFSLTDNQTGWRFWADLQSYEAIAKSLFTVNPTQLDFFPSGSLLFKSDAPTLRTVVLGAGFLLSKKWEMVAGGIFTASGVAAAKGMGGSLGVAYRPYQIPEIHYEQYRKEQIQRLQAEPQSYKKKTVLHYGLSTTILKVSGAGNYFKIATGSQDGIKAGDSFQIFAQDKMDGEVRRPLAIARVVIARPNDSFLRVEQKLNEDVVIQAGQEARRVIVAE
ncbi:MAG: hypothetical protein ACXWQO_01420 [Bdellovibrionota bacterium]